MPEFHSQRAWAKLPGSKEEGRDDQDSSRCCKLSEMMVVCGKGDTELIYMGQHLIYYKHASIM